MLYPEDLRGRPAVVTGAARGIGRAIAEALAAAGADVLGLDSDPIEVEGFEIEEADLSGDTDALAARLLEHHGPFELVVNNVGTGDTRRFPEFDRDEVERVLATNLTGPLFFTRALARVLVEKGRPGSILFISSLHDRFVYRRPAYSASKAGVSMLTRELAAALAPHGIRVNAIAPGAIQTRPREGPAPLERSIPLGRIGRPEDVARVALALLSDEVAGYVTGANVPVDGGLSLYTWTQP